MSTMHPQLQKQRVTITPELYRKLTSTPTTSFAPFYWKPPQNQSVQQRNQPVRTSRNDWGWSDKNYVRLPIVNTLFHSWDKIKESLLNLKKLAELWVERDLKKLPNPPNDFDWFEGIIGGYNDKAKKECNFRILKRDTELYKRVFYALPGIIDQALKLPCRLEGAVPVFRVVVGNVGYIFLCEVQLGRIYNARNPNHSYTSPPNIVKKNGESVPCDSLMCTGQNIPNRERQRKLDDVIWCVGPTIKNTRFPAYTTLYNEFIVYNPNQVKIKYLVKVRFMTSPHFSYDDGLEDMTALENESEDSSDTDDE